MDYLYSGPENSDITFVYAHGAGAHMDSKFMERVAEGLGEHGIRVVRFEFPYMQKRRETGKKRPPDRTPKLLNAWRDVIADLGGPDKLFIGGKSLGGRMATMVAQELEVEETPVRGVLVTGYPFHPLGKSEKEYLRTEHLMELKTPTLICQGARDSFGWWDEVVTYGLPDIIDFHWADDGDHDLKPRVLSGRTMKENQLEAVDAMANWLKEKAAT
ncbi:conserved hypothetical protein [Candidatus Terasakiella magnetica]|uniref:KANL3/Tex30 alpha/beta hydrolase-like domain-containing protein n=1 Tax=Candidatus Terasakiella magnetica TaxID=1867952 RepID=A0A1C3RIB4_9PROT|nr:alpha/beta family hydrolase [Candidatus Terasakiella magnetica]SCA57009.1 conserved hypothetical protein [Candidatus Terasakiella magnetica]